MMAVDFAVNHSEEEYDWRTVSDVKCIIWKFNAGDNANEKKRRKALKDKVGKIYLDTPMIDVRHTSDKVSEYCDCIIITKQMDEWQSAGSHCFSHLKQITSPLVGGT